MYNKTCVCKNSSARPPHPPHAHGAAPVHVHGGDRVQPRAARGEVAGLHDPHLVARGRAAAGAPLLAPPRNHVQRAHALALVLGELEEHPVGGSIGFQGVLVVREGARRGTGTARCGKAPTRKTGSVHGTERCAHSGWFGYLYVMIGTATLTALHSWRAPNTAERATCRSQPAPNEGV